MQGKDQSAQRQKMKNGLQVKSTRRQPKKQSLVRNTHSIYCL